MTNSVLLVEDETKTAEMLIKGLESEGIAVTCATTGKMAVDMMDKGRYDLIILDLKLPEMTGDEVLKCIRDVDPYVDVIVYTNYTEPPVMQKLINLGVQGYISKGAAADLWDTVDKVKSMLDPFSDDERKTLIRSLPKGMFDGK